MRKLWRKLFGSWCIIFCLVVVLAGCAGMICKAPAAKEIDQFALTTRPATADTLKSNATEFQKLYARSTVSPLTWLFSGNYDSLVSGPIETDLLNFAVDASGYAKEAASQPARTEKRYGYEDAMFKAVKRFKDGV